MKSFEDYLDYPVLIFVIFICLFVLSGCSGIGAITVNDYKDKPWVGYSDSVYEFSGTFVKVRYAGTDTIGLRLEEPLGSGWKKHGIKQGDVWMGMADLIFLKPGDWKTAWKIVQHRIGQETITVGILKREGINQEGIEYARDLLWYELRRK